MTCPICNGSGEKDHATLSGYMTLDCTAEGCTAATERAALEAANKAAEPMTVYDQRWFAYGLGKENALEPVGSGEPAEYLNVNAFNHPNLYGIYLEEVRKLRNEIAQLKGDGWKFDLQAEETEFKRFFDTRYTTCDRWEGWKAARGGSKE